MPLGETGVRVDFYVLDSDEPSARLRFACRVTEKAYKLDHSVHAHAGSSAEARAFDDLLWTFRDGSFVPHELSGSGPAQPPNAPVTIGCDPHRPPAGDVLLNLAESVPPFFEQFARVVEIVDGSAESRRRGRERFIVYRDHGCPPETHHV